MTIIEKQGFSCPRVPDMDGLIPMFSCTIVAPRDEKRSIQGPGKRPYPVARMTMRLIEADPFAGCHLPDMNGRLIPEAISFPLGNQARENTFEQCP